MPKTLEALKKEFDAIKKEFDAADADTDNSGHVRGHHDAMVEQGARAIGDRVRELREAGQPGATVEDFKTDKEVATALAEIELHLTSIDKELARVRALSAGPWRKTTARYTALEKELLAEIAARKKEISTKLNLGNKSLPAMETMLHSLKEPGGMYKQFKLLRDYATNTPAFKDPQTYRKNRDRWLKDELAKSKDKAMSQAQSELFERLLVDRNFNKYSVQVRKLHDGVLQAVVDGKAALQTRDANALRAAQVSGSKQLKALEDLVGQYVQARQQVGDMAIETSKGGAKIIAGLQTMVTQRDKAATEFSPISKAKIAS